jgi:hypothetical protein
MKKLIKLTGLFALVFGIGMAVSCNNDEEPLVLDAPTNLATSSVTQSTAELSWNAVENAESYQVSINSSDPITTNSNSHQASGLSAQTAYSWEVRAVNGDVMSPWSNTENFTTLGEPELPVEMPTNLESTNVTHNSATLSWTEVYDATGYEIQLNDGEPFGVTGTPYNITGLTPETEYRWTVRTVTGDRWSDWPEVVTFTTGTAPVFDNLEFTHAQGELNEEYAEVDRSNFIVRLATFDLDADPAEWTGDYFYLDLVTELADLSPTEEFVHIKAGEYTFNESGNAGSANILTSRFYVFDAGVEASSMALTSGTVDIEGESGDNYQIRIEGVDEYGNPFSATFMGDIPIRNPYYVAAR